MVPAAEKPPDLGAAAAEEEEQVESVGLEGCFSDDYLFRLLDDTSVSNRGVEQGDKEEVEAPEEEEEEEEELEWLSNSDAFPMVETSVAFGPTMASDTSVTLEELETEMKELESQEVGQLETAEVKVPTKRRSKMQRRPREVLFNVPFLLAEEGTNEKQSSVRRCTHCLVKETPQWRQGPAGPGTLCNACGVRYKSGRLFDEYRPANSPTFSPGKHSNFHRKVIEMRDGKQTDGVILNLKKGRQSGPGGGEQG